MAVLALAVAFPFVRWTSPLNLQALDLGQRTLAQWRAPLPADDSAIVALDQASLDATDAPMALLHAELGKLLEGLAIAGARAVVLDLILPERSYDVIAPGHDALLLRGILAVRNRGIVMLARTVDESGQPRAIHPPFVAAAGPGGVGFAVFRTDHDGLVRRFDERLGERGASVATLTGELARRLGKVPQAGIVDFARHTVPHTVSLKDVLQWQQMGDTQRLADTFNAKVVFVGAILPFVDRHRVPATPPFVDAETAPGVVIHALTLQVLRKGRLINDVPNWLAVIVGALCSLTFLFSDGVWRAIFAATGASVTVAMVALVALSAGWALPGATFFIIVCSAAASRLALDTALEIRARRRLRQVFAGYVSPAVMKELETGRLEGMVGARREICVLFIDVRGFTGRSETTPPEQVIAVINTLFEVATAAIHKHNGTVKEFMGDGVMAFFGAPQVLPNPARAAFDAAREVFVELPEVNAKLALGGHAPLAIGMGLAGGSAVVGHVGATSRYAYGAVGDCVNIASRLEGLTKELGYPMLISRSVAMRVGDDVDMVELGPHAIKGHSPVDVHGWAPPVAIAPVYA